MIHSFLMIGQSNMAGRGFLKDVAPIYDEHIKMLRNGRWQMMWEPVNCDRPSSGIGLAASFAAAWRLKNELEDIGLIPCAEGGTSLDDWAVGGTLFQHAVFQAKLAQQTSTLDGILWHQGENDSFSEQHIHYQEKLAVIVEAFRRELQVPDIPFIAGELGDFLSGGRYGKYFTEYTLVNQALQQFTNATPNCFFVTASGLTANPDGLHFDAISQRRFGLRYFEAYDQQQHIMAPLINEDNMLSIIEKRPLSKTENIVVLETSFARGELSLHDFEVKLSAIR